MTTRRTSRWTLVTLAALPSVALLAFASRSVFGVIDVEEASYEVLSEHGAIEVRQYAELVLVETRVDADFEQAGNIAFGRLFAYISGTNSSNDEIAMTAPVIARSIADSEQIAMTAPVFSQREEQDWRYAFVLPASYSIESAPLPLNATVSLSTQAKQKVAVLRHSGSWREADMREKIGELIDWIDAEGLVATSAPRFAGYNPPWTIPFLRRNEVMIDVE